MLLLHCHDYRIFQNQGPPLQEPLWSGQLPIGIEARVTFQWTAYGKEMQPIKEEVRFLKHGKEREKCLVLWGSLPLLGGLPVQRAAEDNRRDDNKDQSLFGEVGRS